MASKTDNRKQIILTVGETDFEFKVGLTEFNTFQNEILPNNKVAPSENFLLGSVIDEQKDAMVDVIDQGLGVELASILANQFRPDITIKVKK